MNAAMHRVFAPIALFCLVLAGCATTDDTKPKRGETLAEAGKREAAKIAKQEQDPEPQVIQIDLADAEGNVRAEKRPLYNIAVGQSFLSVNGTKLKDDEALTALLGRHPGLVITVAAHRCLDNERAADILRIAQEHTSIPVTYGSFGEYGDAQCD